MHNPLKAEKEIVEHLVGFYRGVVVDTADETKSGRIRVRVFPFFDGVLTSELPWAIYADGFMGGLADNGSVLIPEIDSHVFVFFENGDHRYPVYFAAAPAIQNGVPDVPTLSRESDATVTSINTNAQKGVATVTNGTWNEPDSAYAATYPNNKVIKTAGGLTIELDDTATKERIHIYHPSGTRTEIDSNGNLVEHVSSTKFSIVMSNHNMLVKGNSNLTVEGNVNINSTGDVNIDSTTNVILKQGTGGIITTQSICPFTGNNHIDGSTVCKAAKT